MLFVDAVLMAVRGSVDAVVRDRGGRVYYVSVLAVRPLDQSESDSRAQLCWARRGPTGAGHSRARTVRRTYLRPLGP